MLIVRQNRDADDAITHFHAARDGKDWLLLIDQETNKAEGCIVAFNYPNNTGWVGFFILNAPIRGNGFGGALMKEAQASFNASNTAVVGLDGVREQVNTYGRRGFHDCAKVHLLTRPSLKEKPLPATQSQNVGIKGELRDIKSVNPKLLTKFDLDFTGLERPAYYNALLAREDVFGYALFSTSNPQELRGCILVRRCEHGHRFGPLYAETYSEALRLLYVAMNRLSESSGSMVAEIFGPNPQGRKVFEELGWAWAGVDYHRMWLNGVVPKEQAEGGKGTRSMFAIFDACAG